MNDKTNKNKGGLMMSKKILLKCPDCKKKSFDIETGKCKCGLSLNGEHLEQLQQSASLLTKKKQPLLVAIASVVLYASVIFVAIFISVLMHR